MPPTRVVKRISEIIDGKRVETIIERIFDPYKDAIPVNLYLDENSETKKCEQPAYKEKKKWFFLEDLGER